jgi:GR25 family glycosyltransferase involved in LPS biosynthesis
MKIFVVNLKTRPDRLENILQQFQKFNITNFEIVEAVGGRSLTTEQLSAMYDKEDAERLTQPLSLSEIGCSLSHINVYNKIIKENKRCLIIEDDVMLSELFKNFVDVEIEDPCDVLFFGVNTSNCEHENLPKTYQYKDIRYSINGNGHKTRCYLENSFTTHGGINFYNIDKQSKTVDFLSGTFAYAPSVDACKKIIKFNYPVRILADFVWNEVDLTLKVSKEILIDVDFDIPSDIQNERLKIECPFSDRMIKRMNHPMYNK